jgi:hypothetical protein
MKAHGVNLIPFFKPKAHLNLSISRRYHNPSPTPTPSNSPTRFKTGKNCRKYDSKEASMAYENEEMKLNYYQHKFKSELKQIKETDKT